LRLLAKFETQKKGKVEVKRRPRFGVGYKMDRLFIDNP
jgi:hypothetical protein